MSSYVYCLYSTEDGVPRYIDVADDRVSHCFKQHIAAALDQERSPLYQWMQDVWRRDFDVEFYTLQESISPADVAMFKQYWIDQFACLLNPCSGHPSKKNSIVAEQVIAAVKVRLEATRSGDR